MVLDTAIRKEKIDGSVSYRTQEKPRLRVNETDIKNDVWSRKVNSAVLEQSVIMSNINNKVRQNSQTSRTASSYNHEIQ